MSQICVPLVGESARHARCTDYANYAIMFPNAAAIDEGVTGRVSRALEIFSLT